MFSPCHPESRVFRVRGGGLGLMIGLGLGAGLRVKVRVSVVTSGSKKCSVCFTQGPKSLGLGERVQVRWSFRLGEIRGKCPAPYPSQCRF